MAPSALADYHPIPARHYSKATHIQASVLYGPRDLRLVCIPFRSTYPALPTSVGGFYVYDLEANGSIRKHDRSPIQHPMNSRLLSRLRASAAVIARITTSSAMAISRHVTHYHWAMSLLESLWLSVMLSPASRLASGWRWKLVCRVTIVGRVSEVDITFALG